MGTIVPMPDPGKPQVLLESTPPPLPSGTVTFLFTDIEGSTKLLQELGEGYGAVLDAHRVLLMSAVERHGGRSFGTEGDAVFAVFGDASSAVEAAADGQLALERHPWPPGVALRV